MKFKGEKINGDTAEVTVSAVNPETGKYNYAVTQKFGTHPYATFAETGYYNEESRSGLTNAKLHLDFSGFAPGLKSETMIAYNIYYFTINLNFTQNITLKSVQKYNNMVRITVLANF